MFIFIGCLNKERYLRDALAAPAVQRFCRREEPHPRNLLILKILIQKEKGARHGEGQALALR